MGRKVWVVVVFGVMGERVGYLGLSGDFGVEVLAWRWLRGLRMFGTHVIKIRTCDFNW